MPTEPSGLLKLLSPVSGGGKIGGSLATGQSSSSSKIEDSEFTELLKMAQSGQLSSSKHVTVAGDAGVSLSETDLARLSVAADKAEASGVRKALVFLDDKALLLDVQSRSITGEADLSSGVLPGVDGVLKVGGADKDKQAAAGVVHPPSGFIAANPSLTDVLKQADEKRKASA